MLCIFSARAGAIPVVELHVELAEVVEVPALQVVAAPAAVVEVEVVDSLAVTFFFRSSSWCKKL